MRLSHLIAVEILALGALALWHDSKASAISPGIAAQLGESQAMAVSTAGNTSVRCPLINAWNPDAGPSTGRIGPLAGFTPFNVESESTTATWFCWHTGTTRANYQTVCRKRCVGCSNGSTYQGEVSVASADLFCLASAGDDAGVVLSVEYGR